MLQLRHIRAVSEMVGVPPHVLKPVQFGYSIHYSIVATYVLASQLVPENMALMVLRVQCYLVNINNVVTDYQFYRAAPEGTAYWILANDTGGISLQDWTNPAAPTQIFLDSDQLLLFPGGKHANILFNPSTAAPGAGTWQIRTTVYALLVPPAVSDFFGGPQSDINVQM